MAKGSQYEREICVQLSRWWTGGERSDIFWRTAGSGGRARVRGRKGEKTEGQHDDVCATDPIGQPLLKVMTIEIKRGYNKDTLHDLIDKPTDKEQRWETWIKKAEESRKQAGAFGWAIIHKRDRREPVAMFSAPLWHRLQIHTNPKSVLWVSASTTCFVVPFRDFLKIYPSVIREICLAIDKGQ